MTIYIIIAYIVIGMILATVARFANRDGEECTFIATFWPLAVGIWMYFLISALFDCIPPIKEWRKK